MEIVAAIAAAYLVLSIAMMGKLGVGTGSKHQFETLRVFRGRMVRKAAAPSDNFYIHQFKESVHSDR